MEAHRAGTNLIALLAGLPPRIKSLNGFLMDVDFIVPVGPAIDLMLWGERHYWTLAFNRMISKMIKVTMLWRLNSANFAIVGAVKDKYTPVATYLCFITTLERYTHT